MRARDCVVVFLGSTGASSLPRSRGGDPPVEYIDIPGRAQLPAHAGVI